MIYIRYHTESTQRVMGKILVAGKCLNLGGDKIEWYQW